MKLLTHSSAKLDKSQNDEWVNAVLYLDPTYNNNICKGKSKGCFESCLIHSGRMRMASAKQARYNRTHMYWTDTHAFYEQLHKELNALLKKADKLGKGLAIRLNGTSDLDWSDIYTAYPTVQFYEYTKRPDLITKYKGLPNVNWTFSKHEKHSEWTLDKILSAGVNVAMVFKDTVPNTFKGIPVIDGDKHDRRFEDKKGRIVGLKLKGTKETKAKAIANGFAI